MYSSIYREIFKQHNMSKDKNTASAVRSTRECEEGTKLFSSTKIQRAVKEIAEEVTEEFWLMPQTEKPIFIGLMNGGLHFFSDLTRRLPFDAEFVTMMPVLRKSFFSSKKKAKLPPNLPPLFSKTVFLVDDFYDTGVTAQAVKRALEDKGAFRVRIITLLDREGAVKPNISKLTVPKGLWVYGYGLDQQRMNRNLKSIFF